MSGMSLPEIETFLQKHHATGSDAPPFVLEHAAHGTGRVRLVTEALHLRFGGTISGPSIMRLVDAAVYVTLLGTVGPVFEAVTANLTINFLRRAPAADIVAHITLVKTGRTLAFADFRVTPATDAETVVAYGSCTYALPRTADT